MAPRNAENSTIALCQVLCIVLIVASGASATRTLQDDFDPANCPYGYICSCSSIGIESTSCPPTADGPFFYCFDERSVAFNQCKPQSQGQIPGAKCANQCQA
ncbi:hypothetical protein WJX73_000783 [Symbiochloris irregularis]|uniref:Uncharacterized protein n=1 Tax=Symbiochloris irregularis TaxID=706552 RepID=A0AAW1PR53_9CHLO